MCLNCCHTSAPSSCVKIIWQLFQRIKWRRLLKGVKQWEISWWRHLNFLNPLISEKLKEKEGLSMKARYIVAVECSIWKKQNKNNNNKRHTHKKTHCDLDLFQFLCSWFVWTVHQQLKMLSLFSHPHIVPDLFFGTQKHNLEKSLHQSYNSIIICSFIVIVWLLKTWTIVHMD